MIGYCGPIGSGKDYEAKKLIENEKFIKVNFTDPLLEDLWAMIKWVPSSHEEYEKFKIMNINDNQTGRDLIKIFGETMKTLHGENYWTTKWHKKIYSLICRGHKKFVVSDVRFQKEFEVIRNFNGKIFFTRYESEKFALNREAISEKIAISLYDKDIKHLEEITNLI
jgi:hypothetical protein